VTLVVVFDTEEDGTMEIGDSELYDKAACSWSAKVDQHASIGPAHNPSGSNYFLNSVLREPANWLAWLHSLLEKASTQRESNVLAYTPTHLAELSEAVSLVSQSTGREERERSDRGE